MTQEVLQIEVDDKAFNAALDKFASLTKKQPATMKTVALTLYQFVVGTFRQGVDPWGAPWPDLSPATLASRRARGKFSVQKLVDSRAMLNTIDYDSGDDFGAVFGGGGEVDDYILVQQFGNPENRAWGGPDAPIPPRPFFPMRNPDEASFPQAWLDAVFAPIFAAMQEAADEVSA